MRREPGKLRKPPPRSRRVVGPFSSSVLLDTVVRNPDRRQSQRTAAALTAERAERPAVARGVTTRTECAALTSAEEPLGLHEACFSPAKSADLPQRPGVRLDPLPMVFPESELSSNGVRPRPIEAPAAAHQLAGHPSGAEHSIVVGPPTWWWGIEDSNPWSARQTCVWSRHVPPLLDRSLKSGGAYLLPARITG